jgi:hypothetical protein
MADPITPPTDPVTPAAPTDPVTPAAPVDEPIIGGDPSPTDPAAPAEPETKAPEAYADFTLPEGMTVDKTALEVYSPVFKELGLSQDQAQKIVTAYAEQVQAGEKAQVDGFVKQLGEWKTATKADKEVGGENFETSVRNANRALSTFGSPTLSEVLKETGLGNHPEFVRVFAKIGALLKEDNPGGPGISPVTEKKDRAEILYGTTD